MNTRNKKQLKADMQAAYDDFRAELNYYVAEALSDDASRKPPARTNYHILVFIKTALILFAIILMVFGK